MGWPKSSVGFSINISQKNLNEIFGHPKDYVHPVQNAKIQRLHSEKFFPSLLAPQPPPQRAPVLSVLDHPSRDVCVCVCVCTHTHICMHTYSQRNTIHTDVHTHVNGLAYSTSPLGKGIHVFSSSLLLQVVLLWGKVGLVQG